MPTYEYECRSCGYKFDVFQKITDKPIKRCPSCRKMKARRLIGRGAGIIFKGSGFYQTDYRSESYNKSASEEKSLSDASVKKDEPKAPTPASQQESKADKKKTKTTIAVKE